MSVKALKAQEKPTTVSIVPVKQGPISRMPSTIVEHMLSFLSISSCQVFKSTRFEYLDLRRYDVHLLARPTDFCYSKLPQLITKWTNWSQDQIKRITIQETPLYEEYHFNNRSCPLESTFESISEENQIETFAFFTKIKIESLRITFVREIDDFCASEVRKISTLTALHLGLGSHISDKGVEQLSLLSLHTLSLMDASHLTTEGLSSLAKMGLKSLTLGCIRFNKEQLKIICGIKSGDRSTLKELSVGVVNNDFQWLIQKMPQLQTLNGRRVKAASYLDHLMFKLFKEEILEYLEHPRDDSRLRQTCTFFQSIYPRRANLALSQWPDFVAHHERWEFIPRPHRSHKYFEYAIRFYQNKGSRIDSIQACINSNRFPTVEIPSLRKLDLEFTIRRQIFRGNSDAFFSGLKRTSLTELSLNGPLGTIPDKNWLTLKPLALKVLSLRDDVRYSDAQKGGVISKEAFKVFQGMPIQKLTLTAQKTETSSFATLSYLLPDLKFLRSLKELEVFGFWKNVAYTQQIAPEEIALLASTLPDLQILNRQPIMRAPAAIQFGKKMRENERMHRQITGRPLEAIYDHGRENYLPHHFLQMQKSSHESWKQRRLALASPPALAPLPQKEEPQKTPPLIEENRTPPSVLEATQSVEPSSASTANPVANPIIPLTTPQPISPSRTNSTLIISKNEKEPSDTLEPVALTTMPNEALSTLAATKDEPSTIPVVTTNDSEVNPTPTSTKTVINKNEEVSSTTIPNEALTTPDVTKAEPLNSDSVANPTEPPLPPEESSGGIASYFRACCAAFCAIFINFFAWIRGLFSRSSATV